MKKSPLLLEPYGDRKWILKEEYVYEINGYCLKVPKGFVTDLASVPRVLWVFFPPYGKYTEAAVVHDYLYSEINDTGINRELADKIFNHIMKELGVSFYKRNSMYRAVRTFGEASWKPKLKNEGYKKVAIVDHTEESLKYYAKWEKILKL